MGYLEKLSDQELREELVFFNLNYPVTKTSRPILIKKLRRVRQEFFRQGKRRARECQERNDQPMEWDSSHDSDSSFYNI